MKKIGYYVMITLIPIFVLYSAIICGAVLSNNYVLSAEDCIALGSAIISVVIACYLHQKVNKVSKEIDED